MSALLQHRLRQSGALVRLAALRRELAVRDLGTARRALVDAVAARDAADRAALALAADQAARRALLRQPLLAAAQARGALDAVLVTFAADLDREAAAARAVADAGQMVEAARADVAAAQRALAAAEARLDRRHQLRRPLAEARAVWLERVAELEAEDFRRSAAHPAARAVLPGGVQ